MTSSIATPTAGGTNRQLTELSGKYLTFFAGSEEYGRQIHKVREIFCMMPVTPVPQLPHHILGVINLRGRVIQVTDFRARVGMFSQEQTAETCIIVVETCGVDVGMVVDKVSEVVNIQGESIEAAPSFGPGVNTDFLLGIGKAEKGVKLLLDIDKVLDLGLGADAGDWRSAAADEASLIAAELF